MTASPLMSLGLRAMSAAYAQLQAAGHNISNANVDGFSRQDVQLATAKGQFTGAGFFGKGVDVVSVVRAHDAFLTKAAATARSLSEMDAARHGRLKQLETIFAPGEAGVGYTTGQFLNAMVDLAARPGDSATRQVVLARAQDFATRFSAAQQQFDTIAQGVQEDLRTAVEQLNGFAKSIAAVNNQIAALRGIGQPPNDLLDERDRLVSRVSALIQVTTIEANDGTIGVFIGGGQRLVLGTEATPMSVRPDTEDPSRASLVLGTGSGARPVPNSVLGGGSLSGILRFQNQDLVDARNLMGQMAYAVAGTVNAQQVLGLNLQQPVGSVPSQPLFAIGAPIVVQASTNQKDATGRYAAEVQLTVTDPSALQPYDYSLRLDPAGSGRYELTRLSQPPLTQLVDSGQVVDGLRIDVTVPPTTSTDRFLLKPVAQAASGLKALLTDPRDLAAASPLVATAAATNQGTAAIAAMTMVLPPRDPQGTARITFTDDAGNYTWELLDSGGNVVDTDTGTWQAGQAIPSGRDINGFRIELSGVPRMNDVLSIEPIRPEYVAANNGNALALAGLRDVALVGRTTLANGSTEGGATATDAYASAMAAIGVRVQTAKATADISQSVSEQSESARASSAGVNLDEEAARLIQYQQSYQAAAKVLQVAQSVFETLLQTAA